MNSSQGINVISAKDQRGILWETLSLLGKSALDECKNLYNQ